ncbi:type 4 pilus major pilin [Methylobacillus sp. Pita2]|uniref:type 4 pilus major pilin n=1 Tax=Methylobacillus sp. Pita2 TaxID=3383245 RepID=UPI0038B58F9C
MNTFHNSNLNLKAKLINAKRQGGFTLVEVGIVAVVVLALLAGVINAPRIMADMRANDEIGELKTISTNVQKIYSNAPSYNGATMAEIIGMKALPKNRVVNATTATNRWSGSLTLTPATLTTADDAIRMTQTAVPEYECATIIPQTEAGFARISVGGTDVKPFGGTMNRTALGTQCTGANLTIDYYFTK